MTELVVALDLDDPAEAVRLAARLSAEADVRWFKLSARGLLADVGEPSAFDRLRALDAFALRDREIFLDLKAYDVPGTVRAIARRAFGLGVRMLTVYADHAMIEAALSAKTDPSQCVLAVSRLTSDAGTRFPPPLPGGSRADGLVCSPAYAVTARGLRFRGKFLVTGIRFDSDGSTEDHEVVSTPDFVVAAGADYGVVGRPIVRCADPVAAAIRFRTALGRG